MQGGFQSELNLIDCCKIMHVCCKGFVLWLLYGLVRMGLGWVVWLLGGLEWAVGWEGKGFSLWGNLGKLVGG
jgi:hypothetical protein